MADRPRTRCGTSLIVRKMQVRTPVTRKQPVSPEEQKHEGDAVYKDMINLTFLLTHTVVMHTHTHTEERGRENKGSRAVSDNGHGP